MRRRYVLRLTLMFSVGVMLAACGSSKPVKKAAPDASVAPTAAQTSIASPVGSAKFKLLDGKSSDRTFVLLPAIITHAEITFRGQIPRFREYGDVLLVDYPDGGFEYPRFIEEVLGYFNQKKLRNPYFVGTSWGSQVAVAVMREYQKRNSPHGPIVGFISVCGPTEEADLKIPARMLYNTFKSVSQADFPRLLDTFMPAPKLSEVEASVTQARIDEMRADMKSYNVTSFFAHVKELLEAKPPRPKEFPKVPAWIFRIGADGDNQVKDQAADKLLAAFPNGRILDVERGTHANLIEFDSVYTKMFGQFIDRKGSPKDWGKQGLG